MKQQIELYLSLIINMIRYFLIKKTDERTVQVELWRSNQMTGICEKAVDGSGGCGDGDGGFIKIDLGKLNGHGSCHL